jgi:hypothetical protein
MANQLLQWLSDGDLRSDGQASEVADLVLQNPQLFDDLYAGLFVSADVVRGHTAHALERISRSMPEPFVVHLEELVERARQDPLPVVRFHLAMLFGNLLIYEDQVDRIVAILLEMLDDESVFTKSWVISSLCILGRKYHDQREDVLQVIAPYLDDQSIAIRTRAKNALMLLTDERLPFPQGWIKSKHLRGK